MSNERLRKAIATAHGGVEEVAEAAEVNAKTVQRWLSGRLPYAHHRRAVARLLGEDEAFLWPDGEKAVAPGEQSTSEVVAAYAHRADLPAEHSSGPACPPARQGTRRLRCRIGARAGPPCPQFCSCGDLEWCGVRDGEQQRVEGNQQAGM
jgi:hypothetical protein